LAARQRDHQGHRIAVMRLDPRAGAKPGHAIAVQQRRLAERFFHAGNVTGFSPPSNLETSSSFQSVAQSLSWNLPTKFRDEPFFGTLFNGYGDLPLKWMGHIAK
jgi:hypothetical protein